MLNTYLTNISKGITPHVKDVLLRGNGHSRHHSMTVETRPTMAKHAEVTDREHDLLLALASGLGITQYDGIGLLEKCDCCGAIFTASRLCTHIHSEVCWNEAK